MLLITLIMNTCNFLVVLACICVGTEYILHLEVLFLCPMFMAFLQSKIQSVATCGLLILVWVLVNGDVVVVIKMGAYIHGVLFFYGA